jgi:folate-binding protein YgfZ
LLQGLVTNDTNELSAEQAVYAGMLTPQGKFMFDMIMVQDDEDVLLDVEAERAADLLRKLTMYKLRADVTLSLEETNVWALFDGTSPSGIAYTDPRHTNMGLRIIATENPVPDAEPLSRSDYDARRLEFGVPDGSTDMQVEKYFWLETDAERLNGVSFTKGCYVGQELTARMKHRTTLKKMLVPMTYSGAVSAGDPITTEGGKAAGEIKSASGGYALAFLRLEHKDGPLFAGDTRLSVKTTSS